MSDPRVLIVEDDERLALVLAARLRIVGETVSIVHTYAQTVEILRAQEFEIIALDLALPDSPRALTIERVLDLKRLRPAAKLVVMSGFDLSMIEWARAHNLGADLCIEKTAPRFQEAILGLLKRKDAPPLPGIVALFLASHFG